MANFLPKLTRQDIVTAFQSPRDDHPGRKGFELYAKRESGWFYPNPEGCTGLRLDRYNRKTHVPADALVT